MANRFGKNQLVMIGKEVTYGTAQVAPDVKLACACEITPFVNPHETDRRNQTLEPQAANYIAGTSGSTVVLSGETTNDMVIFLQAYFMKAASPYVCQTDQSNYSYTIYQAFPVAADDAGDGGRALGCRLESLVITGAQGTAVTFTATFRAQSSDFEVDLSTVTFGTITDTSAPTTAPFLFQNVTCAVVDAALEDFLAFTLTLTNEFADDAASYQNSATRIADTVCKQTMQLDCTWVYGTTDDDAIYDNLVANTLGEDTVTLVSSAGTWAIITFGKYLTYSLPDPDQCLFKASFTKQLLGETGSDAIEITTS